MKSRSVLWAAAIFVAIGVACVLAVSKPTARARFQDAALAVPDLVSHRLLDSRQSLILEYLSSNSDLLHALRLAGWKTSKVAMEDPAAIGLLLDTIAEAGAIDVAGLQQALSVETKAGWRAWILLRGQGANGLVVLRKS